MQAKIFELNREIAFPQTSLNLKTMHENFIQKHPKATLYHQLGWKKVLEATFRLKSIYLCAVENQELTGVLPLFVVGNKLFGRKLVSLPYCNYGGLLALNSEAKLTLLQEADKYLKEFQADYLMLKSLEPLDSNFTLEMDLNYSTYQLKLDKSPEKLFEEILDTKVRNQIRKAQKSGLEVKKGKKLFPQFFKIYAQNTRDLGSPVYSPDFFLYALRQFPNQTEIFVVYLNSQPIGGLFFHGFKEIASAPAASSLRSFFSYCPNNILYWKVIEYACLKGYNCFDFGRSPRESGSAHFKKQWGAEEIALYYEYKMYKKQNIPSWDPNQQKFKIITSIWKKMPLFLTLQLGPRLIRLIP